MEKQQSEATLQTVSLVCGLLALPRFDTPYNREVSRLFSSPGFKPTDISNLKFPKFDRQFRVNYLGYNILRKYPFDGVDRECAALDSFRASELMCRSTNARLNWAYRNDLAARSTITWVREKISSVLGRFDWNEASRHFGWGPGATTRLTSRQGDVYYKFSGKPETTLQNYTLAACAIASIPHWFANRNSRVPGDMLTIVPGSRVTTVPKDWKTDRTIAIEPCMNMYVQKGIGAMIRARLRRVGIDLRNQAVNQALSQQGSLNDTLATVDLSSASDSISYELVDLLLPDDWAAALKQCRSPRYSLASEIFSFEKFSSMGNGFTFELETLLFWAFCKYAVAASYSADRTVSVYGDDIIVHGYATTELFKVLDLFGFTVNTGKSFVSGPFRESCGKHFLQGSDVTPFFVREAVTSPSRLAWFHNSIVRWFNGHVTLLDDEESTFLSRLREQAGPDWGRTSIPLGKGDGGFITSEPPKVVRPRGSLRKAYQYGHDYRAFSEKSRDTRDRDPTDIPYLLRQLYKLESRGEPGFETGILRYDEVVSSWGWCDSWPALSFSF